MPDIDMPPVHYTPEGTPESGEYPFWEDLNPEFLAGENYGTEGPQPGKTGPTAYDVKGLHDRLSHLNDEELRQVPVILPGHRLEQGATYIDLRQAQPEEFTARGDQVSTRDHWYIPKAETPYWLWNRLIGVQNPERLDQSGV